MSMLYPHGSRASTSFMDFMAWIYLDWHAFRAQICALSRPSINVNHGAEDSRTATSRPSRGAPGTPHIAPWLNSDCGPSRRLHCSPSLVSCHSLVPLTFRVPRPANQSDVPVSLDPGARTLRTNTAPYGGWCASCPPRILARFGTWS